MAWMLVAMIGYPVSPWLGKIAIFFEVNKFILLILSFPCFYYFLLFLCPINFLVAVICLSLFNSCLSFVLILFLILPTALHCTSGLSLVDNVRYGTHTPLGAFASDSQEARAALGETKHSHFFVFDRLFVI